ARFAWKVDAGAEFAVTQPVFDPRQREAFLKRVEDFRIPVVAGVWPLISLRHAEFLAHEVPGVSVPGEVLQRMRQAQARGKEAALGGSRAAMRCSRRSRARASPPSAAAKASPKRSVTFRHLSAR